MNGLVSAAAEAEEILRKARWSSHLLDANYDLESDTPIDHNSGSSWPTESSHMGSLGRKRPADQYTTHGFSPGKRERASQSLSPIKKPARFNIHEKLRELYDELSSNEALQASYQGLKLSSYLLEKLLSRMNLNVLIINLYPGNKGYSISLKINDDTQMLSPPGDGTARSEDTILETARWPYEEEELLSYIDNEELPIVLLDLLETEHSSLFYSGCIIAQVRDYRQAYPSSVCDTHHVLLKPTTQSIISDVNAITRGSSWGREERLLLEAALIRATAPPLCLEPRPAVGLLAARLHHQKHLLATPDIRRQAKRYSQVSVNRKRRLDQLTAQRGLSLLDSITKQRARAAARQAANPTTASNRPTSKFPKKPQEVIRPIVCPRAESPVLVAPADAPATVSRLARAYERPRPTADCAPQLLEEYVLEAERSGPNTNSSVGSGVFHVRLSVLHRPANQEYLGELYVDRDYVEGERNGSACRFLLGTRTHANRYIQQFTEIFTEEGRKSVRIKHLVPGQLPRVSYTAGMREMSHANQQLAMQARAQSLAAAVAGTPSPSIPSVGTIQVGPVTPQTLQMTAKAMPPSASPSGLPSNQSQPEVVLVTGPVNTQQRRTISASLPLLQAQLQAGPTTVQQLQANQQQANSPVQQVVTQLDQSGVTIKPQQPQQTSTIQHIQIHQPLLKQQTNDQQHPNVQITSQQTAAQLQQIQNAQQTANQLLAQQLTNPPQPINPHKLQQAIIHIPHPLSGQLLQQKVVTSQGQVTGNTQHVTLQAQPGITIQGQPSITLQGQQGITLQGQQGITLQGQQGITLQGQQGITLQGQQGITLQGQQGITLQGQQGITLQGQQGITLQGQQGITLQGQTMQTQPAVTIQQGVPIQQQGITLQGQTVLQGQPVNIQGQTLNLQAGQTVNLQTGQTVNLQGQTVNLQGQTVNLQGQLVNQQGQTVSLQGQVNLQGQPISLQGQTVNLQAQTVNLQGQTVNLQGQTVNLQGQTVNLQGQQTLVSLPSQVTNVTTQVSQIQKVTPTKQRTTNPAISALVNSLMNSAHQFQQAAAASAAAKSTAAANNSNTASSNATILNLLNSAPAAMTNSSASSGESTGQKKPQTAPSALLERLMAPPAPTPNASNQNSQQSLGLMPGVQNVQVQIPGLSQPISLSLSAGTGATTGLLVSVPVSSQSPASTQSLLSLPITQLVASGVKAGTPLQLVQRPRVAPRQMPTTKIGNTPTLTAGSVQYINQPQQLQQASLVHQGALQQRRRSNANEPGK